ncbi:plasmid mobilization protein [Silvibacterium sp.]|uniref:plasmid mobilization protein n=1 Tax=Silvibacterium sp. TaxID=1964179 RepID=UPI0039E2BA40
MTMSAGAARAEQESNDEIEAVLGRFQRWTASRGEAMPKGVRELTYEEALASSRSRWSQHTQPESPAPMPHEDTGDATNQRELRAEPGVIPVAAPAAAARPVHPAPEVKAANPPASSTHSTPATFREVMAETVRETARPKGTVLARTRSGNGIPGSERQVSISVRMAASEQALIRLRAAAAGISAPAYLRQCAIEVEVLRAQVEQLMAAAARARLAELTAPAPPPVFRDSLREGWWSRWRRAMNPGRNNQLSLRA